MRYSEFNKKLYEFELQHYLSDIHIFCDGNLVGKVSKKCRYSLSTIYEIFEDLPEKVAFMLYENMMMLAETPLAEREEEKKYRVKFPSITRWGDAVYLKKDTSDQDPIGVDWSSEDFIFYGKPIDYIFTEQEIKDIDERYLAFKVEVE